MTCVMQACRLRRCKLEVGLNCSRARALDNQGCQTLCGHCVRCVPIWHSKSEAGISRSAQQGAYLNQLTCCCRKAYTHACRTGSFAHFLFHSLCLCIDPSEHQLCFLHVQEAAPQTTSAKAGSHKHLFRPCTIPACWLWVACSQPI